MRPVSRTSLIKIGVVLAFCMIVLSGCMAHDAGHDLWHDSEEVSPFSNTLFEIILGTFVGLASFVIFQDRR